jgi:UTP--glucose-1-phosphate uridylyltransferase
MDIRKVVIPAAGLGTRLLPVTKELPKEMLPLFISEENGTILLKPILQIIFEKLYDFGFREFCFIVGKGKRAIENHFTSDPNFIKYLKQKNKVSRDLEMFYKKLDNSDIIFINQPEPKGFGDAVYRAKPFTGDEPFLVHAGDDLITSERNAHIKRLVDIHNNYSSDTTFLVEEMEDPSKYGVIEGEELDNGIYNVKQIIEKPLKPPSKLATIAIYIFKSIIYDAIKKIEPDKNDELQLTNAIQKLIKQNHEIYAVRLKESEFRVDIGTIKEYQRLLRSDTRF